MWTCNEDHDVRDVGGVLGDRDGGQGLRLFLELGFRLALLYGGMGLSLEILYRFLPPGFYQEFSGVLSALPTWLVETLGLTQPLAHALLDGSLPSWLVGSMIPLIGVGAIMSIALALGLMWSFGATLASLKNR